MTLEKALFYLTHNSESIIQWLFLAILLLAMILVSRTLFAKKKVGFAAAAGADAGDLQGFLQTILERTSKLESVSVQGMDKAGLAHLEAQVQTLKKDLAARESELATLGKGGGSAAAASSGGGGTATAGAAALGGPDMDKLNSRIQELEAKLAEYEILEDDIADLSLYKEENARMRTELDKLKSGGAPAPAAETPAPVAAAPAPAPAAAQVSAEQIMDQFAQAVEAEPIKGEGAPIKVESTGNNMADFENTLNIAKKMRGEDAPAAESDDLFAEFSGGDEPADEALDTSKVMDELTALESLAAEGTSGSALEDGIDTEKMAAEASSLIKS